MGETCLRKILKDVRCENCNPQFNKNCPCYIKYNVTTKEEFYGVEIKEVIPEIYQ